MEPSKIFSVMVAIHGDGNGDDDDDNDRAIVEREIIILAYFS